MSWATSQLWPTPGGAEAGARGRSSAFALSPLSEGLAFGFLSVAWMVALAVNDFFVVLALLAATFGVSALYYLPTFIWLRDQWYPVTQLTRAFPTAYSFQLLAASTMNDFQLSNLGTLDVEPRDIAQLFLYTGFFHLIGLGLEQAVPGARQFLRSCHVGPALRVAPRFVFGLLVPIATVQAYLILAGRYSFNHIAATGNDSDTLASILSLLSPGFAVLLSIFCSQRPRRLALVVTLLLLAFEMFFVFLGSRRSLLYTLLACIAFGLAARPWWSPRRKVFVMAAALAASSAAAPIISEIYLATRINLEALGTNGVTVSALLKRELFRVDERDSAFYQVATMWRLADPPTYTAYVLRELPPGDIRAGYNIVMGVVSVIPEILLPWRDEILQYGVVADGTEPYEDYVADAIGISRRDYAFGMISSGYVDFWWAGPLIYACLFAMLVAGGGALIRLCPVSELRLLSAGCLFVTFFTTEGPVSTFTDLVRLIGFVTVLAIIARAVQGRPAVPVSLSY
jgi:hypothetical protein